MRGFSFSATKIPKKNVPGKVVDFLSETALAALLRQPNLNSKLGLRNGFFMILMYDTAARCDELLHLRLRDVQLFGKEPIARLTGKGNKTRLVPLMPKTVEHYKRYLSVFHENTDTSSDAFVFYTVIHGNTNALSPDTVERFMQQYGENAQKDCNEIPIHIHPHMLRHTRAIHLYRNGMPLELVSQHLGHASINTTRIYAFADTEMKREAILKAEKMLNAGRTPEVATWEDNEDMILKLSGLK
jgi:site-specific recombinase XerD